MKSTYIYIYINHYEHTLKYGVDNLERKGWKRRWRSDFGGSDYGRERERERENYSKG